MLEIFVMSDSDVEVSYESWIFYGSYTTNGVAYKLQIV